MLRADSSDAFWFKELSVFGVWSVRWHFTSLLWGAFVGRCRVWLILPREWLLQEGSQVIYVDSMENPIIVGSTSACVPAR